MNTHHQEDGMQASEVNNVDDAKRIIEERGLTHVKIGVFDDQLYKNPGVNYTAAGEYAALFTDAVNGNLLLE